MSFCALVDGGKTKEAKLLLRESMEAGQRLTVWRKILEVRSAGCPQLDTATLICVMDCILYARCEVTKKVTILQSRCCSTE